MASFRMRSLLDKSVDLAAYSSIRPISSLSRQRINPPHPLMNTMSCSAIFSKGATAVTMCAVSPTAEVRRVCSMAQQTTTSVCTNSVSHLSHSPTTSNDSRVVCQSILQNQHGVRISWADGHQSFFHSVWLRDHSPSDLHPTTGQRQIDTFSIPLNIKPTACTLSSCKTKLCVRWADDSSVSEFPLAWLRQHCYSEGERRARSNAKTHHVLWDAEVIKMLPYYSFSSFLKDNSVLYAAIEGLVQHGVLFFEGIPATTASTHAIADRIGCIRRTFYGDNVWDTKPREAKVYLWESVWCETGVFTSVSIYRHFFGFYSPPPPPWNFLFPSLSFFSSLCFSISALIL